MIEAELKFKVDNLRDIERKVKDMGGELIKSTYDIDKYFAHPNRNFSETDESFRIRTELNNDVKKYHLTYKGPKLLDAKLGKSREEYEMVFEDSNGSRDNFLAMNNILAGLGFEKSGGVEKSRKTYKLDGIEICIDDVLGLGEFVELEIKCEVDGVELAVKQMRELAVKLGLKNDTREGYISMMLSKSLE